jgi:hypothetical protein
VPTSGRPVVLCRFESPSDLSEDTLSKRKKIAFWALLIALSLVVTLVIAELVVVATYRVRQNGVLDFEDAFRPGGLLGKGGALLENFHGLLRDGYGGAVRWANNSDGFRGDAEYTDRPLPGVLRIMSLGDSFTVGYRVGQRDSFSYLLEQWLRRKAHIPAEVLVAHTGGGGSPVSGLYYFTHFGVDFRPQVLLLGITLGNDIGQAYIGVDPHGPFVLKTSPDGVKIERRIGVKDLIGFRHGLEQIELPKSAVTGLPRVRSSPWAHQPLILQLLRRSLLGIDPAEEPQAIKSYYASFGTVPNKLFDPSTGLGVFLKSPPPRIVEAYRRFFRVLGAYHSFCRHAGIVLAVALFPQRFQVQPGDWEKTVEAYRLNKAAFDLRRPNVLIREFCRKQGIACIDPTDEMARIRAQLGKNLYLPRGDMHWNRLGHRAFFEAARNSFLEIARAGLMNLESSGSRAAR